MDEHTKRVKLLVDQSRKEDRERDAERVREKRRERKMKYEKKGNEDNSGAKVAVLGKPCYLYDLISLSLSLLYYRSLSPSTNLSAIEISLSHTPSLSDTRLFILSLLTALILTLFKP
jgi:hypothetical protein